MNILDQNDGYFIGDVVYKRTSTLGPRRQADLQLVYVYSGGMTIRVDGETYRLGRGEATLLLPGHTEFFRFAQATRHGWCNAIRPRLSTQTIDRLAGRFQRLPFTRALRDLAALAWPLMRRQDEAARAYRERLIQAMFLEFLSRSGCAASGTQPLHPAVERARLFMEEHLAEPLTVQAASRHAGITPAHLIRLFKQQMGITPKHYLWQERSRVAARLLRQTGLTAAEIAHQTGFANPQHFSRVFKLYRGTTPGAVRKEAWGRRQTEEGS